ncbi:MAG: UDP-N-acetylmuramate dehydrogenase [Myxococcota bacterium]
MNRDALRRAVSGEVLFDEPLARWTTLRIGGPADAIVLARSVADVRAAVRFCASHALPCRPLGGGSNLLVRDGGVRGVLIAKSEMRALRRTGATTVEAEAGVATGKLLHETTAWELGGMEFLAGVPGSVGGGLVMNAGTYLGEFKDVTAQVTSVTASGELCVRDHAACGFVYRGSAIPENEIVVEGRFALRARPRAQIEADVAGLRQRRRAREPAGVANAGSIFKNPPGDFAGRLIEQCGLKGRRVGGAEISPAHANWFVNAGGATARDLLALVAIARDEVRARFGVELDLEVKVVGEEP